MQPSFFDLDNRYQKLNERDALLWLDRLILWEDFRETLEKGRDKKRKSAVGLKPFDAVMKSWFIAASDVLNHASAK